MHKGTTLAEEFNPQPVENTQGNSHQTAEEHMQQQEGMKDVHQTYPSQPVTDELGTHSSTTPIVIDTESRLGRGPILLLIGVGIVLLIAIVIGIVRRSEAEHHLTKVTNENAIPAVQVTEPSGGAKSQELRLPANTAGFIDTAIYSRTNGYLKKWFFDIGAHVNKGQLLAIVETPEVDQQVAQAKADVQTAQTNEQIAKVTADRWKALLAKNAVSHQEADVALSDYSAKQSALNSSEANLQRLTQMQDFERIYAPFDGVITARNVDIGSLIQAGDANTPHSDLFHMQAIGKLRIFVPVPEIYVSAVKEGERVAITTDAYPNEQFWGTITRNSTSIDTASRTLNMEVDMDNTKDKLLPGQYAFVHLPLPAQSSSMTIPSNALLFRKEGLQVATVSNNHVHIVPVRVGQDYGATVEVISGLQSTDKVILNPSDSLTEGAEVRVSEGEQQ